ncbi:cell division protein ZapA [Piscinibacterium candidicorallinum]|jgi:cell division protein ZapA|uniref:Cell division protein ZapA n=1 Tax=Piscinibacterium candidicorallinum TaxID=1793872 RepID=A0ABV7GZ71_9BURK
MSNTERFTATIMGREYQLACSSDEKANLLSAVNMVDARMQEIQAGGKIKAADRIAVMVALNLAVEVLSSKGVEGIQVGELKRKIERVNKLADEALSPQEPLF